MIEVFEHFHLQRRILGHDGVNLDVAAGSGTGNVKRRPDGLAPDIKATAVKRDAVDKPFIQIDRVKLRRIGEAIERFVSAIFFLLKKSYQLGDGFRIKDAAWPKDHEPQLLIKMNVGREFHILTLADRFQTRDYFLNASSEKDDRKHLR
ncbi:MAG: hypothetical protein WCE51_05520 [Chthoniobacterales bacterium]